MSTAEFKNIAQSHFFTSFRLTMGLGRILKITLRRMTALMTYSVLLDESFAVLLAEPSASGDSPVSIASSLCISVELLSALVLLMVVTLSKMASGRSSLTTFPVSR